MIYIAQRKGSRAFWALFIILMCVKHATLRDGRGCAHMCVLRREVSVS